MHAQRAPRLSSGAVSCAGGCRCSGAAPVNPCAVNPSMMQSPPAYFGLQDIASLIQECTATDPALRPSAGMVLQRLTGQPAIP